MPEYIEREVLRKILIEHFDADFDSDGKLMYSDHICTGEDCDDLLKLVNKIPTADVEKVVRVKKTKAEAAKEFAKKLRQKIAVMVCSPDLLTLDDYDQCIDDVLKEIEE